jgi:hypothetical protein
MSMVEETKDKPKINSFSNENFNKFCKIRIIQKQLVYIVGLPYEYAFNKVILKSKSL